MCSRYVCLSVMDKIVCIVDRLYITEEHHFADLFMSSTERGGDRENRR